MKQKTPKVKAFKGASRWAFVVQSVLFVHSEVFLQHPHDVIGINVPILIYTFLRKFKKNVANDLLSKCEPFLCNIKTPSGCTHGLLIYSFIGEIQLLFNHLYALALIGSGFCFLHGHWVEYCLYICLCIFISLTTRLRFLNES